MTAGLTAFVAEGAAGRLVSPLTNSAFTQTDMNNLMAMFSDQEFLATDVAAIQAEPTAMLRPVIRRGYYTAPNVTSFAPSWLLEWV